MLKALFRLFKVCAVFSTITSIVLTIGTIIIGIAYLGIKFSLAGLAVVFILFNIGAFFIAFTVLNKLFDYLKGDSKVEETYTIK